VHSITRRWWHSGVRIKKIKIKKRKTPNPITTLHTKLFTTGEGEE